jgi:3-hydroxyisobutyrate dehydrogenase-like beta-hydroxyacid dehydrogenase
VIGASTGTVGRLTGHFQGYLLKGNFVPGFSAALSAKDTNLALELAGQFGVPMAVASVVGKEMEDVIARGWGDQDFDVTVRLQEERAGVELRLPAAS